ncbi:MAG: DinB family protein, partial [Candidatus Limnocylindrales bacterium]
GVMNEVLVESFGQKLWAMKTLMAACRERSVDELTRPAAGFGSILATLNHLVLADAGYVASLGGGRAAWAVADDETEDLRDLAARAEESAARWELLLREPLDGERLAFLDAGTYETHAAVVVMQALHHASAHGEQVCASLVAMGVQAPDLQPWAYADATGRSRWVQSAG